MAPDHERSGAFWWMDDDPMLREKCLTESASNPCHIVFSESEEVYYKILQTFRGHVQNAAE
jgi:hypothetical protein